MAMCSSHLEGVPLMPHFQTRLAEALGFPGLFDSAENVAKLLSGSHLAASLKK